MVENLNNSLPSTEIGQASYRIKVLSNHTKVYINFFENETYGHKLMDKFASYLAIPLSELKLIAKGKTVNKDNVWDLIFMDKCKIFQVCFRFPFPFYIGLYNLYNLCFFRQLEKKMNVVKD